MRTEPLPLSRLVGMATLFRGISVDINQLGIVLMGTVLGWFLMFAVRRYKVQWGAFASFMAIVFGVSLMSFLYARDLLAYYGIGVFLGFVANLVVRVAGTATGGKLGEGLLEMSGVLTDVVETGRFSAMPLTQTLDEGRTHRMRPAEGGVSIGHYRITAGTLGVLARRGGRPVILSNNHVLANGNAGAIGDPILQPGPVDGGRLQDAVARLTDFVPIHFNERSVGPVARFLEHAVGPILGVLGLSLKRLPKGRMNLVDAAVAEPIDTNLISSDILDIGRVTESAEATIGAVVRKSGRTTGLTDGHVTAIDAVVEVDYGGGKTAMFRGQIVSDMLSKGGDSGSLVVDDRRRAVGLLFAGGPTATLINPIGAVMQALEIVIG